MFTSGETPREWNNAIIIPVFILKLILEKKQQFNLETHFLFLDYQKAFDQVNKPTLFNILHKINIPSPFLSVLEKILEHNTIKMRLEYTNAALSLQHYLIQT
jgi:rRNA-processing protein FCF1